jgi:glutathione synthase/RimK-type ligase-like ATP-grasp enzyme
MTIRILPYKAGSRSATALARALGARCLKVDGTSAFRKADAVIINWGRTSWPEGMVERPNWTVLNTPEMVANAANKLNFFQTVDDNLTVPWTTDIEVARQWPKTVARTILNGHSGAGIQIMERGVDIPAAPLYTRYVPKTSEWRIHVFNGQVIDIQRKVRDPEREPTDWGVRSHANGFIYIRGYTREDWHDSISDFALQTINDLSLSFGAVDVIWSNHYNRPFVLEVNTAPGLEGQTVEHYAEAIRRMEV